MAGDGAWRLIDKWSLGGVIIEAKKSLKHFNELYKYIKKNIYNQQKIKQ